MFMDQMYHKNGENSIAIANGYLKKSDLMFFFFFCKNFHLWSEDSKTPYMRPEPLTSIWELGNVSWSFGQSVCPPTT